MNPTVSINLCCYNSEHYLEETLQSIFAQTYRDWELVIVNDGSTDKTEQIIRKHIAAGEPIIYHSQPNTGLGKARNTAIELSHGSFVAIIDHDDLWHPEKLHKQMALFKHRPKIGSVYADHFTALPGGVKLLRSSVTPMFRGSVLIPMLLSNFVPCSCILIRRSVLDDVGLFNPGFVQCEEYDLMIRIAERYEFDYVDEPLATIRFHSGNASWDGSRRQTELIAIMAQALERTPELSDQLGANLVRFKLSGLSCNLNQAKLLQGRFMEAVRLYGSLGKLMMDIPRVMALYLISLLNPQAIAKVIGHWRSLQKRLLHRRV